MTAAAVTGYRGGVPVAELVRSGFVEGRHHGSVVVLDAAGTVAEAAGDVAAPIFPRSSNKPLQAAGMLRSGLRLADAADLAVVCASHWGQEFHLARVRGMLRSAGLDESALVCPPALPLHEETRDALLAAGGGPTRVQMNCSGKHTGMLLTCLVAGWPVDGYCGPEHPLQEALRAAVAAGTGEPVPAVGVDGCGAPLFAASLTGLARAFQHLVAAAPGSVERTVADAMRAHPELVAGTGAGDTVLMDGVPGLLAKNGAEGVAAVAVPGAGAVALKIDDGAARARLPVLVSALRRLGLAAPVLDRLAETRCWAAVRRSGRSARSGSSARLSPPGVRGWVGGCGSDRHIRVSVGHILMDVAPEPTPRKPNTPEPTPRSLRRGPDRVCARSR